MRIYSFNGTLISANYIPGTGKQQWPDKNVPSTWSCCHHPEKGLSGWPRWSHEVDETPAAEPKLKKQLPKDQIQSLCCSAKKKKGQRERKKNFSIALVKSIFLMSLKK